MAFRLIGVRIDQPDDPWWVTSVLAWLSMHKALMEAYGEVGKGYREMAEQVLEQGAPYLETNPKTGKHRQVLGPGALYAVYADYCAAMRREADK